MNEQVKNWLIYLFSKLCFNVFINWKIPIRLISKVPLIVFSILRLCSHFDSKRCVEFSLSAYSASSDGIQYCLTHLILRKSFSISAHFLVKWTHRARIHQYFCYNTDFYNFLYFPSHDSISKLCFIQFSRPLLIECCWS